MEQDQRVRDPEREEAGEWDEGRAGVEWVVTAQEQDRQVFVSAPPAEPKSAINKQHPVTRSTALNVASPWPENKKTSSPPYQKTDRV
jgi:hypothetical protein